MKIEKILTDNPYVDELVYYTKLLSIDCVLKNEEYALKNETLESMKASSLYMACLDGIALFDQFTFTREILEKSSIPPELIDKCIIDNENIPESKRQEVMNIASDKIINEYIELNNYYRMLNGKPDLKKTGIKITNWIPPTDIIIDLTKYVHEMTEAEISVLESYEIIDQLIEENLDHEYLRYVGKKKIDIYVARKAIRFEVLYLPTIESSEIFDIFKSRLDINRVYTLKTIYSEAFKYGSDYYDAFIAILIVMQTIIDVLSSVQELIARKEIFDLRSIQYLFQSYGMPFYPEIPFKYQVAMIKNVNKLIKFKSTTKNMVDICSLFGFDNVEIFKYYLLRNRKMTEDGKFEFHYKEIQDPVFPEDPDKTITVEDNDRNYDLKFVRIPLEGNADDYLRDTNNYLDYDDVTLSDPTWDGDLLHNIVKSEIIDQEFTHVRTKYISIDTVYEITKLSFELPYFFNILYDDVRLEENLTLFIPFLTSSASFKMTDIFCYLFALTYEYNGIEDTIMDTTGKVLHVKGFNFKADLAELGTYAKKKGFTMEELGVSGFQIPKTSIMSYNQLLEIFVKNGKIRDHVIKQMLNADNKKIYSIYNDLYNALMITEFTTEYFRDPKNGIMPKTYTEYLQKRDATLYLSLADIKAISDKDVKIQKIATIVSNIIYALDEYIDSDKYKYLYSNMPSVSGEHIKQYIVKVINFFKSYKIDMLGINTIYKFDDRLDNTIRAIDDLQLYYIFHKTEFINIIDKIKGMTLNMSLKEKLEPLERLYLDIKTWVNLHLTENVVIREKIFSMLVYKIVKDIASLRDDKEFISSLEMNTGIIPNDKKELIVNTLYNEKVPTNEKISNMLLTSVFNSFINIFDIMIRDTKLSSSDVFDFVQYINPISMISKYEKLDIVEKIYIDINRIITRTFKDRIDIRDTYILSIAKIISQAKYDIKDSVEYNSIISSSDQSTELVEYIYKLCSMNTIDSLDTIEKLYIDINRILNVKYNDSVYIAESYLLTVLRFLFDVKYDIKDSIQLISDRDIQYNFNLYESIKYLISLSEKELIDIKHSISEIVITSMLNTEYIQQDKIFLQTNNTIFEKIDSINNVDITSILSNIDSLDMIEKLYIDINRILDLSYKDNISNIMKEEYFIELSKVINPTIYNITDKSYLSIRENVLEKIKLYEKYLILYSISPIDKFNILNKIIISCIIESETSFKLKEILNLSLYQTNFESINILDENYYVSQLIPRDKTEFNEHVYITKS